MKILITGAASAEAYRLKNSLGHHDVLLGDYAALPGLMLKAGNMVQLPSPSDVAYNHKMLAFCLDNNIGAIYALGGDEFALLSEAALLFTEYGITILPAGDEIHGY